MASRPLDASPTKTHIGLNSNQTGDALPYDRMVVDRENSNLRAAGVHDCCLRLPVHVLRENQERFRSVV